MPYLMGAPFPFRFLHGSAGGPSGLQMLLPKISEVDGGGGHMVWTCPASSSQSVTMPGSTSVTYNVTFRIVGVVEKAKYTGGTTSGFVNTDGTPDYGFSAFTGGENVYKITTSDPAHTYFLNAGAPGTGFPAVVAIDYNLTIPVKGGSTISLIANAGDALEEKHTLSVSGITDPAQPYLGQWIDAIVLGVSG